MMEPKLCKMRSLTTGDSSELSASLDIKFEGKRASVIWDSITVGDFYFRARLEIDLKWLRKAERPSGEYLHCGNLVLPRPDPN